ncbi:hypothetical protein Taro_004717 [Colocasia esculenta]|uniref:Uncharacterized protein n=1 Tax=Colocasia esculenta TaxID=4460 RepID=A0A843TKX5_COLES|nr:hypothetical protein [Colocasia esculenta]
MKGECPEIKKDKYKKNNKLKKPKAMIATWSDEDQSEDEEENSSSSENEELCFMAKSSDGKDSQRKGAKEIHKHLMAKKSFNESRKSTIQKTLALTAHSMSSEHSASSSEHKNSNGSTSSDCDSVSTQPVSVSTLDLVPRRPGLRKWDSVSTHSLVVSTQST